MCAVTLVCMHMYVLMLHSTLACGGGDIRRPLHPWFSLEMSLSLNPELDILEPRDSLVSASQGLWLQM